MQQLTVHHGLILVPTHLFGGVLLRCKTPTQLQFCQMAQQVPHHSPRPSPLSLCLFSHVLPLTGSAPVLSTTPLTPCYLLHHPTRWIPLILDTRNSINATFFFDQGKGGRLQLKMEMQSMLGASFLSPDLESMLVSCGLLCSL